MTKENSLKIAWNERGEVLSFFCQGRELAASPVPLFQVQFRDFIGNDLLVSGKDFQKAEKEENADGYVLHFSECVSLPGTRVSASVRIAGEESFWKIAVTPGKEAYSVEWIDYPRIAFRHFEGGQWLLPNGEGMMFDSLLEHEKTWFHCRLAEYALTGISSFYPGPAAMQFEAYLSPEVNLYFSCLDTEHSPKTIDFLPDGPIAFHPVLQHFTGGAGSVSYETVIRTFSGNWQDSAGIYRDWMESNDPDLPAKLSTLDTWLKDSPVLLIYPVKGRGSDARDLEPNEYFPYNAALPVIEEYQQQWHSRILALLMHWEGTAPWAPPYIWPPYGGEAMMKDFIDAMHRKNNLVGLYGSGIGWTQQSMIDQSYDCRKIFDEKNVKNEICSGPHGETFSRVCNGPRSQRIGYDLCPGRQFTADTVAGEIHSASALGVDYLQYFDQNQGCTSPLCYAKDHGHPALPGSWQTRAMQHLLGRAQEAAGTTLIGCENAAAEPYTKVCRLNDTRSHLAWGAGGYPIPLYPYLFHEYAAGFTGNGVCLGFWIDFAKTPFFLRWLLAWHFAIGDLLAVILKDGGKIHWCWSCPWSEPEPEQTPVKTLIGNLNWWRCGAANEFLVCGRMEKKPVVLCNSRRVFRKSGAGTAVPAVESSAWSSGKTKAILLVNYNETAEKCHVVWDEIQAGTVCFRSHESAFQAKELDVEIPALDAVLVKLPQTFTGNIKTGVIL